MVDRVERFLERRFYNQPDLRKNLSTLYRHYATLGVMDSKFVVDFTDGRNDHFYPYLWEMLLARQLSNAGFVLSSGDEGPDFRIEYQGQTIWVEAICPSFKGHGGSWLSAIHEKNCKLTGRAGSNGFLKPGYIAKGITEENHAFIVALNISRLEKTAPAKDEAELRILLAQSDLEAGLENPLYKNISAVLISVAGLEHVSEIKAPYILLRNKGAKNTVPLGMFDKI